VVKVRERNEKALDLASTGMVVLIFPITFHSRALNKPVTYEEIAIMPLAPFLDAFSQPLEMKKMLLLKAKALRRRWKELNKARDMRGKREHEEMHFALMERVWQTREGKSHYSEYDMQLNNRGYNSANQHRAVPGKMEMEDIRVREKVERIYSKFISLTSIILLQFGLKLRTSFGVVDPEAKKPGLVGGLQYDRDGYKVPLSHVLNWLKSSEFANFLEEAKKVGQIAADKLENGDREWGGLRHRQGEEDGRDPSEDLDDDDDDDDEDKEDSDYDNDSEKGQDSTGQPGAPTATAAAAITPVGQGPPLATGAVNERKRKGGVLPPSAERKARLHQATPCALDFE
jgi:hypothetical protein